jgi:hypothetical protein
LHFYCFTNLGSPSMRRAKIGRRSARLANNSM